MNDDPVAFIVDQLHKMEPFRTKRMFGGVGFFKDDLMFGLYGKGIFHLKVDDSNRGDFEAYGMTGFLASEKKKGMPYFEVPVEVLEDQDKLYQWAYTSHNIAIKKSKK